jgi:RNA polymerase sigma-70 factor (ECF subfamily)
MGGSSGQAAWDLKELVERHADRIYRFLLAMTGDDQMAQDIAQETFMKIGRLAADPDGPPPSGAYLFAMARNTAISALRRRGLESRYLSNQPPERIEAYPERSQETDPLRKIIRGEAGDALRRGLAALPEAMRAAFLLSELDGLSYAAIGEALGCPPGTVASRKHQAVQRLRSFLKREGFSASSGG